MNNNFYNKTAAMFGLDARIALAIFGALSVITGAALYSAISSAKSTAFLVELQEIGKAWEAYYLDTGSRLGPYDPEATDHNKTRRRFYDFYIKPANMPGWSGPYLSGFTDTDCFYCYNTSKDAYIGIFSAKENENWGGTNAWNPQGCDTGSADCYAWTYYRFKTDNSVDRYSSQLDDMVDGGDGPLKGNFKWWKQTSGFVYSLKVGSYI